MDRSSKQQIGKETRVLNDTLCEKNHINIFKTFHPSAKEYTFFSSIHETFSRIDTSWVTNQTSVKLKILEIVSSIFFLPQCYETRNQLQGKKIQEN